MEKSKSESLVQAGAVAARIHTLVKCMVKPGLNLLDLDKAIDQEIKKNSMSPAFKGFNDYPSASCLSVNDEVVHAIPTNYKLKEGDIVTADFGVTNNGWMVDTARTYCVGEVEPYLSKLVSVNEEALDVALSVAVAGNTVGDIGFAVESFVTKNGFFIIKDLVGHGIGKSLQEEPQIPNYGRKNQGIVLREGMVLAIEPIISVKKCSIGVLDDDWTIISSNGTESSQFEDTVIITKGKPVILTR